MTRDPANGNAPPAGWFEDPSGRPLLRWWDGTAWTDYLADPDGPLPPAPDGRTGPSTARVVTIAVLAVLGTLVLLFGACVAVLMTV